MNTATATVSPQLTDAVESALQSRRSRASGDETKFLCPCHNDENPSASYNSKKHAWHCFVCGASGSVIDLGNRLLGEASVAELQCCSKGLQGHTHIEGCSLATYSAAKQLPADYLASEWGVIERLAKQEPTLRHLPKEHVAKDQPVLRFPYLDEQGRELLIRHRLYLAKTGNKDNRFYQPKGVKTMPYGLQRIAQARRQGFIILYEGESDTQTSWLYNIPALGIPGSSNFKLEWVSKFLGELTVYVWQEPGKGGNTFVKQIGAAIPEARIITPPQGRKDLNECHCLGDDIPSLMAQLMGGAQSYKELIIEAQNIEAQAARQEAADLISCVNILDKVVEASAQLGLVGEDNTVKLLYLAVTSRVLQKPISVVVKGTSSSGKSYTVETTLELFPPSAFYALSSMSERALAYSDEPLIHRFLVLFEAAGMNSDFGTYLIRTLLSEGRIRYETVEKTSEGLKPRLIEREGPTGLITTTTWANLHPENETRMLSIVARDDKEQTKAVLHGLADRANGQVVQPLTLEPFHALQRWLELAGNREVTIPYAHDLAAMANPRAVRLRRDFGQVLNLIRTSAILHQVTRARDEAGRIVASIDDYATVYELVSELISDSAGATVNPTERETVEVVNSLHAVSNSPLHLSQIAATLGLDKSATSRRVRVAVEHGYLNNLEDKKGKPARIVPGDPMPGEDKVIPTPEELTARGVGVPSIPASNTATVQQSIDIDNQSQVSRILANQLNAFKKRILMHAEARQWPMVTVSPGREVGGSKYSWSLFTQNENEKILLDSVERQFIESMGI